MLIFQQESEEKVKIPWGKSDIYTAHDGFNVR